MLDAWGARDLAATLACFSEDVRYSVNLDAEVPFSGTTDNKTDLARRLAIILDMFDFLARVVETVSVDGDDVRAKVLFYYRHKLSGDILDSRYRLVCRVENGSIVSADAYYDAAMFETFLRLTSRNAP